MSNTELAKSLDDSRKALRTIEEYNEALKLKKALKGHIFKLKLIGYILIFCVGAIYNFDPISNIYLKWGLLVLLTLGGIAILLLGTFGMVLTLNPIDAKIKEYEQNRSKS